MRTKAHRSDDVVMTASATKLSALYAKTSGPDLGQMLLAALCEARTQLVWPSTGVSTGTALREIHAMALEIHRRGVREAPEQLVLCETEVVVKGQLGKMETMDG